MMSRELLPGQVISYPYLWAWQNERGETEGRKRRPTCVVAAVRGTKDGLTHPEGKAIGRFSKTFMMRIAAAFAGARRSGRRVSRLD